MYHKCLFKEIQIRIFEIVSDTPLNSTERAILCYMIVTGVKDRKKIAEDIDISEKLLNKYMSNLRGYGFIDEDDNPASILLGYDDQLYQIKLELKGNAST